jgi:hypothetical protein
MPRYSVYDKNDHVYDVVNKRYEQDIASKKAREKLDRDATKKVLIGLLKGGAGIGLSLLSGGALAPALIAAGASTASDIGEKVLDKPDSKVGTALRIGGGLAGGIGSLAGVGSKVASEAATGASLLNKFKDAALGGAGVKDKLGAVAKVGVQSFKDGGWKEVTKRGVPVLEKAIEGYYEGKDAQSLGASPATAIKMALGAGGTELGSQLGQYRKANHDRDIAHALLMGDVAKLAADDDPNVIKQGVKIQQEQEKAKEKAADKIEKTVIREKKEKKDDSYKSKQLEMALKRLEISQKNSNKAPKPTAMSSAIPGLTEKAYKERMSTAKALGLNKNPGLFSQYMKNPNVLKHWDLKKGMNPFKNTSEWKQSGKYVMDADGNITVAE